MRQMKMEPRHYTKVPFNPANTEDILRVTCGPFGKQNRQTVQSRAPALGRWGPMAVRAFPEKMQSRWEMGTQNLSRS